MLLSRAMFLRVLLCVLIIFVSGDLTFAAKVEPLGRFSLNATVQEGPDGVLYGLDNHQRCIIRVKRDGSDYRVLSNDLTDVAAFAFGRDGKIYGATTQSYFRVSTRGHVEFLGSFPGFCGPGAMILAPDGNVYGVGFPLGGRSGVLFVRMGTDGSVTKITSAPEEPYFQGPFSLIIGHDGSLWGTWWEGVFRLQLDGQFSRPVLNNAPETSEQILAHLDGNYYFIGYRAGSSGFYRLTPEGDATLISNFSNFGSSGFSALTVGRDGYFYGINSNDNGIARVSTTGEEQTIVPATDQTGHFFLAHDGRFYGTGNRNHIGVLYRLSIPGQGKANLPPVALGDVASPPQPGAVKRISVLSNDTDANGDSLTIVSISAPLHGSVSLDESGRHILYTAPDGDRIPADEFTYTVADSAGGVAVARVVIRQKLSGRFAAVLPSAESRQDGYLRLDVSGSGAFSGRLWLGGFSRPICGSLDAENRFTTKLPGKLAAWSPEEMAFALEVRLHLFADRGNVRLEATVSYEGEERVVEIGIVDPRMAGAAAGRYTWVLPPDTAWASQSSTFLSPAGNTPSVPVLNPLKYLAGFGRGAMRVSASGSVRVAGRLPDGTPFAVGNIINATESLQFFAALHRPPQPYMMHGWLRGRIVFRDRTNQSDADGTVKWCVPFRREWGHQPLLNSANLTFLASRYIPADSLSAALGNSVLAGRAGAGGLSNIRNGSITSNGENIGPDGSLGLTGIFLRANGFFFGKFRPFGWLIDTPFDGVVFQKQKKCFGAFRSFGQRPGTGFFEIEAK
jgi:hypothetical protein